MHVEAFRRMSSDAGSIPAASTKFNLRNVLLNKKLIAKKKRVVFLAGLILFLSIFSFSQNQPYLKISVKDYPDFSRAIIESPAPLAFDIERSFSLLMVKIETNVPFLVQKEPFESRLIKSFGWTMGAESCILTIETWDTNFRCDCFTSTDPPQLVIDFRKQGIEKSKVETSANGGEATENENHPPAASQADSKTKDMSSPSQRIKTVVIDPGHGGLEPGAKGRFGTQEKYVVLAISLKLKTLIERNLALRVVLTREEDVDVSLETRAAKANNNKADLFLSIHANSSYRKEARGSETYFLSAESTDEEARRLAYLENNPSQPEKGISGENEEEIKMILWDLAQTAYLNQSSLLAESIQNKLNSLFGTKNRGIKQAPFKVLTGVACPAVLLEVAFISNVFDERDLRKEDIQNKIAQAIFQGLEDYIALSSQGEVKK